MKYQVLSGKSIHNVINGYSCVIFCYKWLKPGDSGVHFPWKGPLFCYFLFKNPVFNKPSDKAVRSRTTLLFYKSNLGDKMTKKVVAATFLAKPDSKEALHDWIVKTAHASRQEIGVEKYLINFIDKQLGHYLLVGIYSSEKAFDDHVNSKHVENFLKAVPDLVTENFTYVATPLENESDPKSKVEPS
jgi:quinol monooxygenase YgiN